MRRKRLYINIFFSLLNQFIVLICGFILPKFILGQYGSEVNGLISSITQFLGFITLLDLGVGAVIQSTLYKPLAEKNNEKISLILNTAKRFFRIIALILLVYVLILAVAYPKFINHSFGDIYTASLILIIAISSFGQYYFAIPYQLLLNADQRLYVQCNIQTFVVILNTILSVILIQRGCSIQIVKLVSSLVFLIRPFFLVVYVKRNYKLDTKLKSQEEQIEQKWNGMAQHCAAVVMNNTDVMILSVFASLNDVSIYSVYNLVLIGLKQFISALSNAFHALFGDILAKKEVILLNEAFDLFEWFMHTIVIFVFTITTVLIVPFVLVYTKGVVDADYYQPLFAILICIAQGIYCLRIPYNTIVCAACHYKQTQGSAVIEMLLNIIISLLLVRQFGLIGVAIGTIVAMSFRTAYFVFYLHHNILFRKYEHFAKHITVDLLQIILIAVSFVCISFHIESYWDWIKAAICYCIIAIFIMILINIIFYKKETIHFIYRLHN